MRKPSIISITSNYSSLLIWLRDLETNPDFKACRVDASGYLLQFETFDTYFKLELLRLIFTVLEDSSTKLQGSQLNFRLAESIIGTLKNIMKSARSDSRFDTLWEASTVAAKSFGLDDPEVPRKRKAPSRYETSTSSHHFPETAKDHYWKIYFAAYDGVIVGLSDRFEPTATTVRLRRVEDFLIGLDSVDYVQSFYGDDFEDYRTLSLYRTIIIEKVKRKNIPLDNFQNILDFLRAKEQIGLKNIAAEAVKLIKIVLTMPAVTTCTAERSFSGLRRLKTYLRSTMTQVRLNSVSIVNVHSEMVRSLELDALADTFISRNAVRMRTFSLANE